MSTVFSPDGSTADIAKARRCGTIGETETESETETAVNQRLVELCQGFGRARAAGAQLPRQNCHPGAARGEQARTLDAAIELLARLAEFPDGESPALGEVMLLNWELGQDLFAALRPHRLTVLQWLTLREIAAFPSQTTAQIGRAMGRLSREVASVCYALATAGWITEDRSGRQSTFRATERIEAVLPVPEGFSSDALARLRRWRRIQR